MEAQLTHESVNKLADFIHDNNIVAHKALCIGLDPLSFEVCQKVCREQHIQCVTLDFFDIEEVIGHEIDLIFAQKKDIRIINELLWKSETLKQYICVDTDDITQESDGRSKLMNKKLWDYTANNATNAIEGGGWISSYTRKSFLSKEMDEYVQNVTKKISPYLTKLEKVLEVGCSSGLTMYAVAPFVREYVAVDMSSCMIRKNKKKITQEGWQNITLYCLYAHELDSIEEEAFDVGIMNSVVHCFEGHFYFKRVLKMLINKMSNNGIIFLGDILDADKKTAFEQSLHDYKERQETNTKTDLSQELFLSKGFIEDLPFDFTEISHIEISDKIFTIENELTQYRYDVLIKLDKNPSNPINRQRNKHQYGCDISSEVLT